MKLLWQWLNNHKYLRNARWSVSGRNKKHVKQPYVNSLFHYFNQVYMKVFTVVLKAGCIRSISVAVIHWICQTSDIYVPQNQLIRTQNMRKSTNLLRMREMLLQCTAEQLNSALIFFKKFISNIYKHNLRI